MQNYKICLFCTVTLFKKTVMLTFITKSNLTCLKVWKIDLYGYKTISKVLINKIKTKCKAVTARL